MATTGEVRNIIVGAAQVFISTGDSKAALPTVASNKSYGAKADWSTGSGDYKDMGLTTGCVELSYAPNYGEVTVDQLLDAARLFKQSMQVMVNTTLSEGTLENMNFAFGQKATQLDVDSVTNKETTLKIGGGALGESPVERTVIFVGQAPYNLGKSGNTAESVTAKPWNSTSTSKERVYIARRVVQMETVSHSLRRDGATEFPVNFRCLPDTDVTDGSEYGKIIDRVYA